MGKENSEKAKVQLQERIKSAETKRNSIIENLKEKQKELVKPHKNYVPLEKKLEKKKVEINKKLEEAEKRRSQHLEKVKESGEKWNQELKIKNQKVENIEKE